MDIFRSVSAHARISEKRFLLPPAQPVMAGMSESFLFAGNPSSEYLAASFPPQKIESHIVSLSNTPKYRTGASISLEIRFAV